SLVGDWTCSAWGGHHTIYHIDIGGGERLAPALLMWAAVAGIASGLASRLFAEMVHGLQAFWKRFVPVFWLRPVAGAGVVICLVLLLDTRDYLGLGVHDPD